MNNLRRQFAAFMQRQLIGNSRNFVSPEEWSHWIINHYFDEKVETIRADIVRLSIAEKLFTSEGQQKLIGWHEILVDEKGSSDA